MSAYQYIYVDEVKHETENAVLVEIDGDPYWFPKSQLEDWPDVGYDGEMEASEWILEQKGLL